MTSLDNIMLSKITYCVILYILNLPFIIKKSMNELKVTSYILFSGIILLVVAFIL